MTRGANNQSVPTKPDPPEVQLKLLLMRVIDQEIRRRYRTLNEAAHVSTISRELLSRVRHGDHRRCSIAAVLRIAVQLNITIKISVEVAGT